MKVPTIAAVAAVAAALPGSAAAAEHLSVHQARVVSGQVARALESRAGATDARVDGCRRISGSVVDCRIYVYDGPVACPDVVRVRAVADGVRFSFPVAPDCAGMR